MKKVAHDTFHLNIHGSLHSYKRAAIMGILNLNDNSFYAGSRTNLKELLTRITTMVSEGMDILDIGAQSTRPGAEWVDETWEKDVLTEATKAIRKAFPKLPLSIDSFRTEVIHACLDAGASIINNVGFENNELNLAKLAMQYQVPYILMHFRGDSKNMHTQNNYNHLIEDVIFEMASRLRTLQEMGVMDVIIDPGFGFAKNQAQNFELLRNLEWLHTLNRPIMVGISRKSTLYKPLNIQPEAAGNASTVAHTIALMQGAQILRVHDVKLAKEAIELVALLNEN